jgi:hypothetical protein
MKPSIIETRRIEIFRPETDDEDVGYWLRQTPEARMVAQELNRQAIYDYDPSAPIQRVLEIFRVTQS